MSANKASLVKEIVEERVKIINQLKISFSLHTHGALRFCCLLTVYTTTILSNSIRKLWLNFKFELGETDGE